jgi:hypothetical protein
MDNQDREINEAPRCVNGSCSSDSNATADPLNQADKLPIYGRPPKLRNQAAPIRGVADSERTVLLRIGWNAFSGLYDFSSRGHKIIQTRTGNDYRVAPAMRLFCYSHEPATLVLSEFYEEMLTLYL